MLPVFLLFAEPIVLSKEPTVRIQCMSGSMIITIKDPPPSPDGKFSGMVYPKGLSKNSTCLSEYRFVQRSLHVSNNRTKTPFLTSSLQGSRRTVAIQTATAELQYDAPRKCKWFSDSHFSIQQLVVTGIQQRYSEEVALSFTFTKCLFKSNSTLGTWNEVVSLICLSLAGDTKDLYLQ